MHFIYTKTMTEGDAPKTSINKTYELDVDDVGSVPHCTEIQKQTDERYLYSAPYQTEPVYESPLCLELNANTTQRRESAEGKGRRCKRNDIYETANDAALPNGRCYTGYSYVTNTENVIPRLSQARFAYDNPVRATAGDADHEYEESLRNARCSKNVVYDDIDSSKAFTIEGIRDTKTGAPNRNSHGNDTRKQRANCVQIFTLLLSILACLIGILALLVASGKVKLNDFSDVKNETVNTASQIKSEKSVGDDREKLAELLANYARMKKQVESSKQNYTELMAKYNEMSEQVESSKQNCTELMAKYNEMSEQVESSKQNYTELMTKYNNMTGQFNTKLKSVTDITLLLTTQYENVNSNVLFFKNKLHEFNSELEGVTNVSQQLNNTLKSINSKFTARLRNVSKQMGPRGFNGSQGLQGPQGPQGVGNMSACIVNEHIGHGAIAKGKADTGKVTVKYKQRKGWKVMSAVCSTVKDAGAVETVLSRNGNAYTCTCVTPSKHSIFKPNANNSVKCKIIYWECPELT